MRLCTALIKPQQIYHKALALECHQLIEKLEGVEWKSITMKDLKQMDFEESHYLLLLHIKQKTRNVIEINKFTISLYQIILSLSLLHRRASA